MMTWKENLRENKKYRHLMNMAILRKFETELSVNIWVDQKKANEKKIYFQDNKVDRPDYNLMIPMSISEYPKIKVKNYNLQEQDVNLIKKFVIINLDILLKLGDSIGIIEFAKQMKKVE